MVRYLWGVIYGTSFMGGHLLYISFMKTFTYFQLLHSKCSKLSERTISTIWQRTNLFNIIFIIKIIQAEE